MKHAIDAIRAAIKPVASNLNTNRENSAWYDKEAKGCARQIEALTKQMQTHADTRDRYTAAATDCEATIAELEAAIAHLESKIDAP